MRISGLLPLLTLLAVAFGMIAGTVPHVVAEGETIGAIARGMPTAIDPAPYAFSIWTVIFAGQAVFAVHQMLPRYWSSPLFQRARVPAIVNSLAAGCWALAYVEHHYAVAWMCMVVTLASLVGLAMRIGRPAGTAFWTTFVTYRANLAWISVAMIVNTTQLLHYQVGWDGAPLSPIVWAVILVIVAAALAALMLLREHDAVFPVVVGWALVAIAIEQRAVGPLPAIAGTLAVVLTLGAVATAVRFPLTPRPA